MQGSECSRTGHDTGTVFDSEAVRPRLYIFTICNVFVLKAYVLFSE